MCISDLEGVLCCFASTTFLTIEENTLKFDEVSNGNKISTINIKTGKLSDSEILKFTKQTHLSLLKISTTTKEVEITLEHPLFIKDYGFISLKQLQFRLNYKKIDDLINKIEILTWNKETATTVFEKIINIEKKEGVFNTYSILKISKGDTYIANGFITKVY